MVLIVSMDSSRLEAEHQRLPAEGPRGTLPLLPRGGAYAPEEASRFPLEAVLCGPQETALVAAAQHRGASQGLRRASFKPFEAKSERSVA